MSKKILKELAEEEINDNLFVPDTSVIIEGVLSKLIVEGKVSGTVLIHNAVLAELEHQANKGRPIGMLGIDEIIRLRQLEKENKIVVEYEGERPTASQIKYAKLGEIDSSIRDLAISRKCSLITADKVQNEIAKALGVKSIYIKFEKEVKGIDIERFFDSTTMSVHLREGTTPKAKKGKPGEWDFKEIRKKKLTGEEVEEFSKDIIEKTKMDSSSFIEIDRRGSTIVQFRRYRIVMTRPPLSDGWEITAVKPVKILSMSDYNISEKLNERLKSKAEGILVAGAPGNGKSTFCQALAVFYLKNNKIVKTVEAPRDLVLPQEITQYSKTIGSNAEIHDILLLSRPDYTIFDEIRNTDDFKLFKDLRLSGVGMAGVVHATNPIDAIQRFVGRIELGMVPSIIDTVIFIDKGQIGKVLELKMTVRVPSGMTEQDLARPIIEVTDFLTGELEYEMYTFGEQTVMVPVSRLKMKTSAARTITKTVVEQRLKDELPKGTRFSVEVPNEHGAKVFMQKNMIAKIIGKGGKNIDKLEKKIGIHLDILELETKQTESPLPEKEIVKFRRSFEKRNILFTFDLNYAGKSLDFFIDNEYLFTATVSKRGEIKIANKSDLGQRLINSYNIGEIITASL